MPDQIANDGIIVGRIMIQCFVRPQFLCHGDGRERASEAYLFLSRDCLLDFYYGGFKFLSLFLGSLSDIAVGEASTFPATE
jgi:hypothetical protein